MVRCAILILFAAAVALILLWMVPSAPPGEPVSRMRPTAIPRERESAAVSRGTRPGLALKGSLALRCVDADSRDPVPLVQVDAAGVPRSFLTDRGGLVLLPLPRGTHCIRLRHPLYRPADTELEIRGDEHRELALHKLTSADQVEFEGIITCNEGLLREPEVRVAIPSVRQQGEQWNGEQRTQRVLAHIQQLELPVHEIGPDRWRFSVRLSVFNHHTFMVMGLLPPVDRQGCYRGDVVFVALKELDGNELRRVDARAAPVLERFHLERCSPLIALDIADESGWPLRANDGLLVGLAHDSPLSPGMNYDLTLRPAGPSLEIHGLPAVMRLQVLAAGFEPCLLPHGARGLDDRIHLPACLTIRLKREVRPPEDAIVEAVVESEAAEEPVLNIIDPATGEGSTRPFTQMAGSLWQVRMGFRSGGPCDLFVLMPTRTIVVTQLWLQPGVNRLDLPPASGAAVSGLVTRRGVPLPGVDVTWRHGAARVRQVETDEAGRFVMQGVTSFPVKLEIADSALGSHETFRIARSGEIRLEVREP